MKKSTKKVPLEITNETRTEEIHKLLLGVRIRKKKRSVKRWESGLKEREKGLKEKEEKGGGREGRNMKVGEKRKERKDWEKCEREK